MKKIGIILFSIMLLFVMVSCNKETNQVEEGNVKFRDVFISLQENNYNHYSVNNTNQEDQYIKPNQKFYLHINLDNPESNEIISVIINGVKYQSFNFEKESTSEEIIIELESKEPGIEYYQVEEIKYIQNLDIFNVIFNFNDALIKVVVSRVDVPKIYVEIDNAQEKMLTIKYRIISDLIYNDKYRFILMKDGQIVKMADVSDFNSQLNFYDLEEGKQYDLLVVCYADMLDGNGEVAMTIYNESFLSYSPITFQNIICYDDKITYNLKFDIEPLSYKVLLNDDIDITNTNEVEGLESDTNYKLTILFKRVNGKEERVDLFVRTKSNVIPEINNFLLEPNKNSIKYQIQFNDMSKLEEASLKIYDKNDQLIEETKNFSGEVDGLLSNNIYKFTIIYSYYINNEKKTIESTKYAITLNVKKPVFKPIIVTFDDHIYCGYDLDDVDGTVKYTRIYFAGSSKYETLLNDANNCLKELEKNSEYTIIYKLDVDYNDGAGIKTLIYSYKVRAIESIKQLECDISPSSNQVNISISSINYLNNPSLKIEEIELYRVISSLDMEYVGSYNIDNNNSLTIDSLDINQEYSINIKYSYNSYLDGIKFYNNVYGFTTCEV